MVTINYYLQENMSKPTSFQGYVTNYSSTFISLSDGVHQGTYYGSFTYGTHVNGIISSYDGYVNGELSGNASGLNISIKTLNSYAGKIFGLYKYILSRNDSINGSNFDDILLGFKGDDNIIGRGGDDNIGGDLGNDTLTGGEGADRFIFNSKLNKNFNVDTITDFETGVDKIVLQSSLFKKLGGSVTTDEIWFKDLGDTQTKSEYLVFESSTGTLSYDADANGKSMPIKIAIIGVNIDLQSTDLLIA